MNRTLYELITERRYSAISAISITWTLSLIWPEDAGEDEHGPIGTFDAVTVAAIDPDDEDGDNEGDVVDEPVDGEVRPSCVNRLDTLALAIWLLKSPDKRFAFMG